MKLVPTMILRELEIRNFMSLECVSLDGLGQMNVLIGRNNVGKSAVFRAIEHLVTVARGRSWDGRVGERESILLTDGLRNPSLSYRLVFELNESEREDFLTLMLEWNTYTPRDKFLRSKFLNRVVYSFEAPPNRSTLIHLVKTQTLARGGETVTVQELADRGALVTNSPPSRILNFQQLTINRADFGAEHMQIGAPSHAPLTQANIPCNQFDIFGDNLGPSFGWLLSQAGKFFRNCFFFAPHRHSQARVNTHEVHRLRSTPARNRATPQRVSR